MVFPVVTQMWEWDYKESWASKNWCFWTVVLEKALEGPLDCKEFQPVHLKANPSWIFNGRMLKWNSNTLATCFEEVTHLKRPWCWERLKSGGEGDDRGWDGWMASPTQWTWVWVNSRSWWWTGRPGVLHGVTKNWTRLSDWTELSDPAILLPGIYLEKTIIWKDTCTPIFTAALFTIARTWKQPKCPSAVEWVNMCCVYTMEYYSAIKFIIITSEAT